MRLYIIGNGFDLNHGLNTRYSDFRNYLIGKRVRVYDFEKDDYCPNPIGEDWSNIEQHLELNYLDLMYDTVNTFYPDLNDDSDSRWNNISVEISIKTELANEITHRYFREWIRSIKTHCSKKHALNSDDYYITFNYTHTLENVYGIKPLHVHGAIEGDIQFGCFENNPTDAFKRLEEEYSADEWYGASIEEAVYGIKHYCENTFKDYAKNKERIEAYLTNKSIDEIVVMGHNYLGIDECYYRDIFTKYRCKWIVYCHSEEELRKASDFADKYGLIVECIKW